MKKEKRFCIRIDGGMKESDVLERLKVIAAKRKRSVSFLIREALLEYVERQEAKDLTID